MRMYHNVHLRSCAPFLPPFAHSNAFLYIFRRFVSKPDMTRLIAFFRVQLYGRKGPRRV